MFCTKAHTNTPGVPRCGEVGQFIDGYIRPTVALCHFACALTMCVVISLIRGKVFRQDYDRLGELRSILPSPIPVMALTATASCSVYETAVAVLGMHNPVLISAAPNRSNLHFHVIGKKELLDIARDIAVQVYKTAKDDPKVFPKTIVFCRK